MTIADTASGGDAECVLGDGDAMTIPLPFPDAPPGSSSQVGRSHDSVSCLSDNAGERVECLMLLLSSP